MNDEQFAKFSAQLGERFDQIDGRFDQIDQRFTKIDERFDRINARFDTVEARLDQQDDTTLTLYKHVEEQFADLRAQLDTKADRDQVEKLYTLLDPHAAKQSTDEQERAAMNAQIDRQHGWIEQLAKHTKTRLVPEP